MNSHNKPLQIHNDDEIIIVDTVRVLEIRGSGCIIHPPDLSGIRYMAHRLEIRNITLGTLGWIPEWILEVYLENCQILANSAHPNDKLAESVTNLPQSVIQLTCRGCQIPEQAYTQLAHHRLIRLELINQGLSKLPQNICVYAPNILFLNLTGNKLTQESDWPVKIRGLRINGNKLSDLAHLGQLPPYLEDLDLSNNIFTEIPVRELSPFLRKLNMSQNELNWLPEDASDYPPNLRELNIARNCGLDDLTDAVLPDMLTTLNAAECEISRLPHELNSYCLTHMDLSDNNITNLDELPFDKVMNINYVGNPCWTASGMSSSRQSTDQIPSDIETINDNSADNIDNIDNSESDSNSVFTSGSPSPVPLEPDENDYMAEYKAAISRSSSQEELKKKQSINNTTHTNNYLSTNTLPVPENDPIIKAIDYIIANGFNHVGSFLSVVSDILRPDISESAEQHDNSQSIYESPNNSLSAQVLDDLDHYGIFGTFD